MPKKDNESTAPTCQRIAEAARELFAHQSLDTISTELLCKTAGVSKTSLYKYFGNMSGVLVAVVEQESKHFQLSIPVEIKDEAAFWRVLVEYGVKLLTLLSSPFCVRMDQLIHEQARKQPELAVTFYESTYGRSHLELTKLLELGIQRGYLKKQTNPSHLADHLLSMWEGLQYVKARLNVAPMKHSDVKTWVSQCVELLLKPN